MRKIVSGNESVAHGALRAGVRVVTGYPGTPSTECLDGLLGRDLPGRHVEWSTNEKVALEIAAGAAWAGHRALCTMKMTGLNVAYDALISIAYSGTNGGLVIYVADDPGVSAGMAEQDSRGFAQMAQLPMLEPGSPAEAYELVQLAFELSEAVGTPVFLRSTTSIALGYAAVEIDEPTPPRPIDPILERDISRYTKAGSAICMAQHRDLIARFERAARWIEAQGLNRLDLAAGKDGLGILAVGGPRASIGEALHRARADGLPIDGASVLEARTTVPFPADEARRLLERSATVLVVEELEPYMERDLYVLARQIGWSGRIVGKLDGTLSRIGELGTAELVSGLESAVGRPSLGRSRDESREAEALSAPRPVTVCPGCPHRGTYLAIIAAIRKAGYARDKVMVTGDIGCTILGMNPPFDLLWNEVSMGSSIGLAQGYVHAGVTTPVIATIGDSTFFHAGIPGLINAIQHRVPLTLVILDNGWTAMTGMQVNPGTEEAFQDRGRRIDLERLLRGLGIERLFVVDPYDLDRTTDALVDCLTHPTDVSVVLARRECAIQAQRRGVAADRVSVDPEKCILCNLCLQATGCPALGRSDPIETADGSRARGSIVIDPSLCNGCGLCVPFCPTGALVKEEAE